MRAKDFILSVFSFVFVFCIFFLHKDQYDVLRSITARKQSCVFDFVFVFVFVAFCISLARWAAHPGVWGQLLQESRAGKPRVGFD